VALQEYWSNANQWYEIGAAGPIFNEYQLELERVCENDAGILKLKVHCLQCHIPFITAATNRGRKDLRCPMGCRNDHRRRQSKKRSTAYYQDEAGSKKKKDLNQRRNKKKQTLPPPLLPAQHSSRSQIIQMKQYLRVLIGLLEHRKVSEAEIEGIYQKIKSQLRQHSLVRIKK
jgi:hypothetical protein